MGYLPQVAACACWRKANAKLRGVKGPKSKYDVVIPGAGHDGLVAAGYLARAGLVLERNDYVGGATMSQKVFADYEAHFFPLFVPGEFAAGQDHPRSWIESGTAEAAHGVVHAFRTGGSASQLVVEQCFGSGGIPGHNAAMKVLEARKR